MDGARPRLPRRRPRRCRRPPECYGPSRLRHEPGQPLCPTNLVNLSVHSPVAVAYVHASDMDAIQVCHSLTRFPAVLGDATPMDNRVVALQGKSLDGSIPIIFPADAFERTTVRAYRLPIIVRATGHGAAPPVFRAGPHGGGVADTDEVNVRKVMTLPPSPLCQVAISQSVMNSHMRRLRAKLTVGTNT